MSFVSRNPATGRRLATHREHTRAEIERALARAHAARRPWRALAPAARANHLHAVARELLARRDELAALATAEMGKPVTQARGEVEKCARTCEYFAQHGPALLADEHPPGAPAGSRVVLEPLGVVLAILPWNFPFWQIIRAAAPALMGGNTLLLKHAPNVLGCALAMEEVFARAGVPRGVFQVLVTGVAPVPALIADARVRAVTFTGGTVAGKHVAALAATAMKPGVFELGGSDPYIVLADADLALAAETCAAARLINSGQSCASAKRFIVARSVAREFETLVAARLAARRTGDPTDPATDVGPLARPDLCERLHRQIAASVRGGARLVMGGAPLPGPGNFFATTLLAGVRPGMPAADEELFGPAAAILVARDEADAVRLANATPYGLGAAIFTRSARRARALIPQIDAGFVAVNRFIRSDASLPFGGVKDSGLGRELGGHGLRSFLNLKTVTD
ncbi:MAG: aldehyde dehydrogenase family protein [Verrucomicrobia bacterium]|nr:aldehyde dehydrogenase family protein [Verrucomicrobiota bacterium]